MYAIKQGLPHHLDIDADDFIYNSDTHIMTTAKYLDMKFDLNQIKGFIDPNLVTIKN